MGGAEADGKLLTNWICQVAVAERATVREDWNRRVTKEKVLAAFGGWRFPWLDLPGLIDRTSEIYEFPLVDRDPIDGWTSGRVTLIGDAAHPMQPVGAQAGSQAIVDGRVLAAALVGHRDPVEALAAYQDQRIAAMNDLIIRNRNLGLEAILQIAEERAPGGFKQIHDVLSKDELESTAINFKKAAGFDVETVNSRESVLDLGAVSR
jgi:2-polyprenyl-6-methoxyphenol hydroxylase-like FAD-dependent oxidoreductase